MLIVQNCCFKLYFQQIFLKKASLLTMIMISLPKFIVTLLFIWITVTFQLLNDQKINNKTQQIFMNQTQIEMKQIQLLNQYKSQSQNKLSEWIAKQMEINSQQQEIQPHQEFMFMIQPQKILNFRMPISQIKTRIEVNLFDFENNGEIFISQNRAQQDYAEVSLTDNDSLNKYLFLGRVYISKIFQLNASPNKKFINIQNKANRIFIVLINLEQSEILMDLPITDDEFAIPNKMMQTILQETKNTEINRESLFKWQWGYQEKYERHQTDMLGFTAVQVLAIIGTSIVQMYCIKQLINNELII